MNQPVEQSRDDLTVYFEPGMHPLFTSTVTAQTAQVQQGDFNVHAWNSAVRERMRTYKPGLLAIDSLDPLDVGAHGDLDTQSKAQVWYAMPGTPSQINGTDEVLVVAGDNTYNTPHGNSLEDMALRYANMAMWGVVGAAGTALISSLMRKGSRPQHGDPDSSAVQEDGSSVVDMTRRRFLFSSLGAALVFGQHSIAPFSPWRSPEPIAAKVDDVAETMSLEHIVDPDHQYEYLVGRTALLIAKIHDAAAVSGVAKPETVGSVVMGDSHMFESNDLLSDPSLRAKSIRAHTVAMLEAARGDHTTFQGQWSTQQKQQWVIGRESTLQLLLVKEPDDARLQQDPVAELDRTVQLVDQIEAPSVVQAIQGL
jgi:hypothetical protein